MFERFGEMNSFQEINELAENLFNEGDIGSLKAMAAENGIPEDFVEMFCAGDLPGMPPDICESSASGSGGSSQPISAGGRTEGV